MKKSQILPVDHESLRQKSQAYCVQSFSANMSQFVKFILFKSKTIKPLHISYIYFFIHIFIRNFFDIHLSNKINH